MSDSNITKLNSLTITKVDRGNPSIVNAPSDGTLSIGSITNTDIPIIVNNENYSPYITPVNGADNFRIKDGTVVFNRDNTRLQYFINGSAVSLEAANLDFTFSATGNINKIVAGSSLIFANAKDNVNVTVGPSIITGTTGLIPDTITNISSATINNAAVLTTSQIFVTPIINGMTPYMNPLTQGTLRVNSINGQFTVYSSVKNDNSSFFWMIVNMNN